MITTTTEKETTTDFHQQFQELADSLAEREREKWKVFRRLQRASLGDFYEDYANELAFEGFRNGIDAEGYNEDGWLIAPVFKPWLEPSPHAPGTRDQANPSS